MAVAEPEEPAGDESGIEAVPASPVAPPVGARSLSLVVLISGAAALTTEISASRLLAPFFGSSTIVWANIIGLILVYLSVGYWVGGRIADRHPSRRRLGAILLGAAATIAVLPFVAKPALTVALHAFNNLSAGAVIASFFATLLLFAVPVTLLGMVSPFAIRLAIVDVERAGTVAGRLYALSTMGSIAGTFVPALVTIPLIGTQRTMIGAATGCALAAVILLGWRWLPAMVALAGLLLVPPGVVKEQPGLIAEAESAYQYADVVATGDGARHLQLNEGVTTHSVWHANSVLTGGEWDAFLVLPAVIDHPVRRVLVIGNAGGTTARAFGRYYPDAEIDGVEIDATVTDLGRRYMGLNDNPRLQVADADGRTFLELSHESYDLIIVDAYHQPYIPFHLATAEFFQLCREHLTPGGALALNVERIPTDESLARAVESTVASVLPDTWRWPALRFNEIVVAINDSNTGGKPRVRRTMDPDIAVLGDLFDRQVEAVDRGQTPFTDDRAPVEWITDRTLIAYIAGGGDLSGKLLPTDPARSRR